MRKKKATGSDNLDEQVKSYCDGYWERFERTEPPPYEITGKYLFFSANRDLLIQIALEELGKGGFHHAKTHMVGVKPSGEYVLCLYYKDDSRKHELAAKYKGRSDLKYRYWKSDQDTYQGKYSKEFLDKLSLEDRKFFQRKRGR